MKKYTVLVNGMVVGIIEASPAEVRHLEQDKTIVLIARQSPEGGIYMNTKSTLSKETLLVYLINELSSGNYKVTTDLDEGGCWVGRIHIESCFEEDNDDDEYYMKLVKHMK